MSDPKRDDDFLDQASPSRDSGLIADFVSYMRENSKWWLTPILVVFGLFAVLLLLGSTGALPWLYTLW